MAATAGTRDLLTSMYESVRQGRAAGKPLGEVYRETYQAIEPRFGDWVIFDPCLSFDVTRAYGESGDYPDPRIWTAERDTEMWHSLQQQV